MEAGELRHRITIQEKSVTRDDFGGEVITWVTHCEAWAAIEPLQGREFIEARLAQAEVTDRIRMRYQAGIRPEMRVLFGTRVYEIQTVLTTREIHHEIQMMCKEQINAE